MTQMQALAMRLQTKLNKNEAFLAQAYRPTSPIRRKLENQELYTFCSLILLNKVHWVVQNFVFDKNLQIGCLCLMRLGLSS